MSFDPELCDIRFGCGLSPLHAPPASVASVLAGLTAPDRIAQTFPIETFPDFRQRMIERQTLTRFRRQNRGTDEAAVAKKTLRRMQQAARKDAVGWFGQTLLRRVHTDAPFRERLTQFWADHFTATGKQGLIRRAMSPYIETAIRPHVAGRFEDLLISAVSHPLMLHYLDQILSIGPNSAAATRRDMDQGLNENLAREVLELHTLGVGGPYTQTDVRQLAELLTGLTFQIPVGFKFNKNFAEPGSETVLGQSYGGDPARLDHIHAALRDLARHPATARHLSEKLAVHFVSDLPDPALVAALEARYLDTGGDLLAVYDTLLRHPASWGMDLANVKQPVDFISSALRALAVAPDAIQPLKEKQMQQAFLHPMRLMGQVWEKPGGPDGWPEEDNAWISPQGVAARLQWAVSVPQTLVPELPDPRDFVKTALGRRAPPVVNFAASAAESRWDGVGLVLASPAFQRM